MPNTRYCSFENFHQGTFVALLDKVDQLLFVMQIQHMQGQGVLLGKIHPYRAWRVGHDASQERQPVRVRAYRWESR